MEPFLFTKNQTAVIKMKVLLSALLLVVAVNGEVVNLTTENFITATSGKNSFIKFFAPWCGHCKSMADDWIKLSETLSSNSVVLVGEVDCTTEDGKPLCEEQDVQGFPTLKYGNVFALEEYDGGRDYDSLHEFASHELLKPQCSPENLGACSDNDRDQLESFMKMDPQELNKLISELSDKKSVAQTEFETKLEQLNDQYKLLMDEKENSETNQDLVLVEAILENRSKIQEFLQMSDEELTQKKNQAKEASEQADSKFQDEVKKLQDTYQEMEAKLKDVTSQIKSSGYGMMKSVQAYFTNQNKDEL